jgi:hypothetical protein
MNNLDLDICSEASLYRKELWNMTNNSNANKSYEDIIGLPHHVSKRHPQMSRRDRAAQFAPFAALTGHGAAITETARITQEKLETSEDKKYELDQTVKSALESDSSILTVEYFVQDEKKSGGSYRQLTGRLLKVDEYDNMLILEGGYHIPVEDIIDIQIQD